MKHAARLTGADRLMQIWQFSARGSATHFAWRATVMEMGDAVGREPEF